MLRSTLLLDENGDPYRRKDGRLVHLIQGGSAPTPPPAPQPVPPAAPEPPGTPTPPPAPPVPSVVPPGATVAGTPAARTAPAVTADEATSGPLEDASPERLREIIAQLRRREAAGRETRNEQVEQRTQQAIAAAVEQATKNQATAIGKALGLIQDDAPVTPEQLTAQFTEKESGYQKQIRELTLAAALTAALAGTHPGAKDALIGSGKLADLDPTAADFTTQLQTRVTEYLDANPYFKVTTPVPQPPAGSSGGEFHGGPGAPELDKQIAEALKAGDIQRSIALKRAKARIAQ